MSVPKIALSGVGSPNTITYNWSYTNVTQSTITSLYLHLTDVNQDAFDSTTAFQVIQLKVTDTSYNATNLTNGRKYAANITADMSGNTYQSNTFIMNPKSVPVKPTFVATGLDGAMSVQLTNMSGSANIGNDGFSPITQVVVLYCDGSQNLVTNKISVPGTDPNLNPLSDPIIISLLTNGVSYEVSVYVINSVGHSPTSNQAVITPTDKPDGLQDVTAYPSVYINTTLGKPSLDVSSNTLLWNNSLDSESLLSAGIPITKYTISKKTYLKKNGGYIIDPSAVDLPTIIMVDPSGNPLRILDASGAAAPLNINSKSFTFKFIDTNVTIGKIYKYTIFASNINGDGPAATTTGYITTGSLPTPPSITVVPNNETIKLSLVSSGILNGFDSSGNYKYVIDISSNTTANYAYFDFSNNTTGYDPSSNTLNITKLPLSTNLANPSQLNPSTGQILKNGTKYTLKIYTVTYYDGTALYSKPLILTTTPYTIPNFPSKVSVLSLDASGVPLNARFQVFWTPVFDTSVNLPLGGSSGNVVYSVYISSSPSDAVNIPQDPSLNVPGSVMSTMVSKVWSRDPSGNNVLVPLENGTLYYVYVRTLVYNTELGIYISSTDSQPTRYDTPLTYPSAVSNLQLSNVTNSNNKLQASWDSVTPANSGGFSSLNTLQYKLILTDLSNNSHVDLSGNQNQIDGSGNMIVTTNSATIVGATPLTPGKPYKLTVFTQGLYTSTDASFNSPPVNTFNNYVVVKNSSKISAIPFSAPEPPSKVSVTPMNLQIRVLWDKPQDASTNNISNGVTLNNYEIFNRISGDTNYTYPSPYPGNLQPIYVTGIVDASLTEIAVINKAVLPSNSFQNLENDRYTYLPQVRANGYVGGYTINGETLPRINVNGTLNTQIYDEDASGNPQITSIPIGVIPSSAPNSPSGVNTTSNAGSVTLQWTKASGVTEYIIYLDNETFGRYYGSAISPADPFPGLTYSQGNTSLSLTITGLVNGVSYNFGVVAVNNAGVSSSMTTIVGTPYTSPDSIRNPNFTIGDKIINLYWNVPQSGGGAGVAGNGDLLYKVTIYTDVSGNADLSGNYTTTLSTTNNILVAPTIAAPFTISNLTNGKSYMAMIQAYYNIGNKPQAPAESIPVYVINMKPNVPPQNVSNVQATASNRQINLSWSLPTDSSLYPKSKISIQRTAYDATGAILPDLSFNIDLSANVTSFTDVSGNKLYNGNAYEYNIKIIHTSNSAQQVSGVTTPKIIPFSSPIFASTVNNIGGTGKNFSVSINKNGSDLSSYTVVGIPIVNDASGIQIVTGNFANAVYSNTADNTKALAANQLYTLSFTTNVAVNNLFIAVTNSAGVTTGTWPTGSSAFGAITNNMQ